MLLILRSVSSRTTRFGDMPALHICRKHAGTPMRSGRRAGERLKAIVYSVHVSTMDC